MTKFHQISEAPPTPQWPMNWFITNSILSLSPRLQTYMEEPMARMEANMRHHLTRLEERMENHFGLYGEIIDVVSQKVKEADEHLVHLEMQIQELGGGQTDEFNMPSPPMETVHCPEVQNEALGERRTKGLEVLIQALTEGQTNEDTVPLRVVGKVTSPGSEVEIQAGQTVEENVPLPVVEEVTSPGSGMEIQGRIKPSPSKSFEVQDDADPNVAYGRRRGKKRRMALGHQVRTPYTNPLKKSKPLEKNA